MIKALMGKNWKWIFIVYIIVLVVLSLVFAFVMRGENNWERGVYWTDPTDGGMVNTELTMSGRIYCKDEIQSAELIFNDDKVYPIERTVITHKGKDVSTICVFMNEVSIDEGINDVKVRIVTADKEYIFHTMTLTAKADYYGDSFVFFSKDHFWAVAGCVIMLLILLGIYKLKPTENTRTFLYLAVAIMVLDLDLINRTVVFFDGGYNIATNLPLHMCDLSALALFALMFMKKGKRRDIVYDMLFIWGVAGAFMALITPDLIGYGFPTFTFFNFFFRHGGIVIGVLLVTFIEGYRPKLKALPMVLVVSAVMAITVYGLNWLMTLFPPYDVGNYMFVMYPPLGGSPIDLMKDIFGPSPWYMIGLIILTAIFYILFWIPFGIEGAIKRKKHSRK
jgi:hypothetical integral membrane protein (TIGR02206 family)